MVQMRYGIALLVISVVAMTLGGGPAQAAAADATSPSFSVVSPFLKLEQGKSAGRASIVLKLDRLDPATMGKAEMPKVEDLNTTDPPTVTVTFTPTEMQPGSTSRSWALMADIANLPTNTIQTRYLKVNFAGVTKTVEYTLTNKFDPAFTWTLKPPGSTSITPEQGLPIGVAVGPLPASDIRLVHSTLLEQSRKYNLGAEGLEICRNEFGECETPVHLTANSGGTIWLRSKDGVMAVGHFVGSVTINSPQKPEGDTISLDVYVTNWPRQLGGAVAILFGVFLAWVISTWGRSRYNRDQLLLPAALLREKLRGLQGTLAQAPPAIDTTSTSNTRKKITSLLNELTEEKLETANYIPLSFPSPYAGAALRTDDYRQFLQKRDDWVAVLRAIIEDGMAVAWGQLTTSSSGDAQRQVDQSVRTIDAFIDDRDVAPTFSTVASQINGELTRLSTSLSTLLHSARDGARALTTPTVAVRTYDELRFEIRTIGLAVWIAMAILTTLVGTNAVVLSNLGFGLVTDYLVCLFWGLGLPIGAQQLNQLTTASVSTTLGVSISK